MDKKMIGARVREQRERLHWTVVKLGTLAGRSASYISRLERGETSFSHETIVRIAGAMAVPLDHFYRSDSNVSAAPAVYRVVPVLDYVQAGQWRAIDGAMKDEWMRETVPVNMECPPSTFALKIRGDSMSPLYTDGDIVIIDPTRTPRPGSCVVATDESGEATFKQYRDLGRNEHGQSVFELIPLNPLYPSMRSDRQQLAIVGVAIQLQRSLKS